MLAPAAITGQPFDWGGLGAANWLLNQLAITGWKRKFSTFDFGTVYLYFNLS
ncbi:MAG: hypothetical protein ACE5HI_00965 [bacterium]